jgi:hypothetical protein
MLPEHPRRGRSNAGQDIDLFFRENTMHRFLIVLALLMTAPLVSAQVYKWSDASGTVHYSQSPPTKGTQFKEMKPSGVVDPTPPAAPATVAPKPITTEVADTPANRANLCNTFKTSLTALQGTGAVVVEKDGKQTALDDAGRKQETESAEAKIKLYCQTK